MSVFTSDVTVEAGSTNIPVTVVTPLPAGTNQVGHVVLDTGSTTVVSNFPATQPVSGTVAVSNFPATQPVSGTVSATQGTSPWVVSGTVTTSAPASSSCTITRVATSTTAVTLLAANANRKKAIIMTETGTSNYVAFGSTATATNYTYLLGANTVLEVTVWTGSISLIRSSGTGNVQVTELV